MKASSLIPINYVIAIVEKNIIANSVPISSNQYMKYLFTIWYNYIEPNSEGDLGCPYCLNNILGNFKAMQDDLIEIYKQDKLINML